MYSSPYYRTNVTNWESFGVPTHPSRLVRKSFAVIAVNEAVIAVNMKIPDDCYSCFVGTGLGLTLLDVEVSPGIPPQLITASEKCMAPTFHDYLRNPSYQATTSKVTVILIMTTYCRRYFTKRLCKLNAVFC